MFKVKDVHREQDIFKSLSFYFQIVSRGSDGKVPARAARGDNVRGGIEHTEIRAVAHLLRLHVKAVGHIAGEVFYIKGLHLAEIKRLDRVHHRIVHLLARVGGHSLEIHVYVPAEVVMTRLGDDVVALTVGGRALAAEGKLARDGAVVYPERDIHALERADVRVGEKAPGEQVLALIEFSDRGGQGLRVDPEGDDAIRPERTGYLIREDDVVPAVGADERGRLRVRDYLRAAGTAVIE